ncbi:hypothetical protein TNCV_1958341 [Trichonephila clavipes]|nr:hypothetical protein TNCV_1958341 [Trichonephila clavipes]
MNERGGRPSPRLDPDPETHLESSSRPRRLGRKKCCSLSSRFTFALSARRRRRRHFLARGRGAGVQHKWRLFTSLPLLVSIPCAEWRRGHSHRGGRLDCGLPRRKYKRLCAAEKNRRNPIPIVLSHSCWGGISECLPFARSFPPFSSPFREGLLLEESSLCRLV